MHQRDRLDFLRRRPRQTSADSPGPRRQTRGTRLQRSRFQARSLRQLKYATTDTDNKHR